MNKNKIQKSNLIWIGTIVNTHSLKGEIRLLTNSSIDDAFSKGRKIYYKQNNDFLELEIDSSRKHKNFVLLKFVNFSNINDVLFLKGKKIYGERDPLEEDNFYYEDLINYEVYEKNELIGKIISYFDQKAYYSFEIKTINDRIFNLPVLDKFILKIDKENKKIEIDFLQGNYE